LKKSVARKLENAVGGKWGKKQPAAAPETEEEANRVKHSGIRAKEK